MILSTLLRYGAILVFLPKLCLANIVLQEILNKVNPEPVTDEELRQISGNVWANDCNRFSSSDVILNGNSSDARLFEYVNEDKLNSTLTFVRLMDILDNYIPRSGIPEPPCLSCDQKENDFLDAVIDTDAMQLTHGFLVAKGLVCADRLQFRNTLRDVWFTKYIRNPQGGAPDSCGFEHVFCGELSGRGVSGFHNWVRVYLQERSGLFRLNGSDKTCQPGLRSFPFIWRGKRKRISSMFIGSSPEAEIAIYTICFLARPRTSCNVLIDGLPVRIVTVDKRGLACRTVSTSYPICT